MKLKLSIIFTLCTLLLSCNNTNLTKEELALVEFNQFLGKEKAESLNLMVESLDTFLDKSYPSENSRQEKLTALFQFMSQSGSVDSNWVFDTEFNKEILEQFESSEMRSEIYLYPSENYEPKYFIENEFYRPDENIVSELSPLVLELEDDSLSLTNGLDSLELIKFEIEVKRMEAIIKKRHERNLSFNNEGQFLYGLSKFGGSDTVIQNYVQIRLAFPSIHPFTFIEINFNKGIEYENPFFKRIVIADIYYLMIKADIEKEKTKR